MGNRFPISSLIIVLSIVILGFKTDVFASRFDKELKQRQRELNQLKNEIESQKTQVKKLADEELGTLEKLENLRKNLESAHSVMNVLSETRKALDGSIGDNEKRADSLKNEIEEGQDRLSQKIVYLYKHGEPDYAASLLNAQSKSEWLEDYVYLKKLLDSDKRLVLKLQNQKFKLDSVSSLLVDRQIQIVENQKAQQRQQFHLNKKSEEEQKLLKRLQGSKELVQKAVLEYESHQKILSGLIRKLEKQRKLEIARAKAKKKKRKKTTKGLGKVCKPIKGKIISEYGYQMHPDLKTKTKNLGVEIQAKSATKVKAARSGVIAQIVDLPGKGTSIIVDHGDSYYSVYGRLSRSKVKVGQKVNSCQEIANIGVASKSKPRLFFQVSKGVKTINPRDWLRNAQ